MKGTRVLMTLPKGQKTSQNMNKQILVVDDEPEIRSLLKEILEEEGFIVELAENAEIANQNVEVKKEPNASRRVVAGLCGLKTEE